jgi:DNA-binding NarL/FixJ family response regulator
MPLSVVMARLSGTVPETSMRILVVDDHEVVRKGVRSVLGTRKDIEVCGEAANGQEAIETALQLRPDLIILDVTMPTMDGLTAAREIKKVLPKIPIIILSMHDRPAIARAAQKAGAQGFVTKGSVSPTLLNAVDAVLRGETFFKE